MHLDLCACESHEYQSGLAAVVVVSGYHSTLAAACTTRVHYSPALGTWSPFFMRAPRLVHHSMLLLSQMGPQQLRGICPASAAYCLCCHAAKGSWVAMYRVCLRVAQTA